MRSENSWGMKNSLCDWTRRVYLPAGRWVHLWTGEVFGDIDMGGWVEVDAPVGEPAVFYAEASAVGPRLVENLRDEGIEVPAPE